jgi:hypothetical protein
VAWLQMRAAARGLGTLGTTLGLMRFAGLDVGLNPFAPGFGKVTVGKVEYDLTGGEGYSVRYLAQMAQTLARLGKGEQVKPRHTPLALTTRYLRSQLQPAASAAVDWQTGETFEGRPFTYSRAAVDLAAPFVVMDAYKGFEAEGLLGVGKTLPASVLGVSVQTYQPQGRHVEGDGPCSELTAPVPESGDAQPGRGSQIKQSYIIEKARQMNLSPNTVYAEALRQGYAVVPG